MPKRWLLLSIPRPLPSRDNEMRNRDPGCQSKQYYHQSRIQYKYGSVPWGVKPVTVTGGEIRTGAVKGPTTMKYSVASSSWLPPPCASLKDEWYSPHPRPLSMPEFEPTKSVPLAAMGSDRHSYSEGAGDSSKNVPKATGQAAQGLAFWMCMVAIMISSFIIAFDLVRCSHCRKTLLRVLTTIVSDWYIHGTPCNRPGPERRAVRMGWLGLRSVSHSVHALKWCISSG